MIVRHFFFAPRIHTACTKTAFCTGKLLKACSRQAHCKMMGAVLRPGQNAGHAMFLGILWQRSAKGLELVEGVKMRKDRLLQDTITQTFKNHLVTILYRSTILICSYHSLSSYPSTLDVWIQGVYRSFTQSCIDEVTTWMYWRSELLSSMGCPGACDWGWAPWIVFMYVSTENEESDNSLVHTPPL